MSLRQMHMSKVHFYFWHPFRPTQHGRLWPLAGATYSTSRTLKAKKRRQEIQNKETGDRVKGVSGFLSQCTRRKERTRKLGFNRRSLLNPTIHGRHRVDAYFKGTVKKLRQAQSFGTCGGGLPAHYTNGLTEQQTYSRLKVEKSGRRTRVTGRKIERLACGGTAVTTVRASRIAPMEFSRESTQR